MELVCQAREEEKSITYLERSIMELICQANEEEKSITYLKDLAWNWSARLRRKRGS